MRTVEPKEAIRERVKRYREKRKALQDVTPECNGVTLNVTPDVTLGVTPVTPDVTPKPIDLDGPMGKLMGELSDLRARVASLEIEVQGISEKLADVLTSIGSGDVFIRGRGDGGHRKVAQPVVEGAFSKSRQAEGRMGR